MLGTYGFFNKFRQWKTLVAQRLNETLKPADPDRLSLMVLTDQSSAFVVGGIVLKLADTILLAQVPEPKSINSSL